MLKIDPFAKIDAWLTTIKDLEKRWGLSAVSFLPLIAQKQVKSLQDKISMLPFLPKPPDDPILEFYETSHLHCTHFTLKRSNGWGMIKVQDFVKPQHTLFELFEIINKITSSIQPFKVKLDALKLSRDGLGIILTGACINSKSVKHRQILLVECNKELPKCFDISPRSWDRDSSKFHELHCRIGFLKRPFNDYKNDINNLLQLGNDFLPISFTIENISIVHHQYRSLKPPQVGEFQLPLGLDMQAELVDVDFFRKLNLQI